jgi:hypothetical protein
MLPDISQITRDQRERPLNQISFPSLRWHTARFLIATSISRCTSIEKYYHGHRGQLQQHSISLWLRCGERLVEWRLSFLEVLCFLTKASNLISLSEVLC